MILAAYFAIPILLAIVALVENRTVSCLICGFLLFVFFMITVPENKELYNIFQMLPAYPVSLITRFPAPMGFLFPAKLLSMITTDPLVLTAIFSAGFSFGIMSFIYRSSEIPAASAIFAVTGGFLIFSVTDPCLFVAVITVSFAVKYALQRRFLRYAALVLLASCFCIDSLLLLPLYFILLIPSGLPLLHGGAAAAVFLILSDVPEWIFGLLHGEAQAPVKGLSPLVLAALGIFCLWTGFMNKMVQRESGFRSYIDFMIKLIFTAAFLSLVCIQDDRFLPLMLMCAFPAVLTLSGTLLKTSEELIVLTFKNSRKNALFIFIALLLSILLGWYGWIISDNSAALGLLTEAGAV